MSDYNGPYPKNHRYHFRWLDGHAEGVRNHEKWEEEERREAELRQIELDLNRPWDDAIEAVSDPGVFSDDQIAALTDMIDNLKQAVDKT